MKKPAAPPVPAAHHRNRIRHRDGSGKFKKPPSGDDPGPAIERSQYMDNSPGQFQSPIDPSGGSLDADAANDNFAGAIPDYNP
jgi:hypothetical protein